MRNLKLFGTSVLCSSLLSLPLLGVLSTPAAAVNLCAPGALTPSVVEMVMNRSDFDEIISQMSATCPKAALDLTAAATAATGGSGDPGVGDASEPEPEPESEPEPEPESDSEDEGKEKGKRGKRGKRGKGGKKGKEGKKGKGGKKGERGRGGGMRECDCELVGIIAETQ